MQFTKIGSSLFSVISNREMSMKRIFSVLARNKKVALESHSLYQKYISHSIFSTGKLLFGICLFVVCCVTILCRGCKDNTNQSCYNES